MSECLKVDTDELRAVARSLTAIRLRLESAANDIAGLHGELGSGRLAETMDRFASDWQVRRRRLCGSVEAVEQMALQSARKLEACDQALARSVSGGAR
ncbi:hypothetical protein [Motilibacter aurantiacus]|uniref:hypothetical protein n=1 Tax=Motilibacter aurantiacus TaxID=2714955 RepID=UPI00140A022D|nr:hypothetical protein [Motilibacter aurantiacus]NHC47481.1 hypothetical protein [Motilibacter aurantiacus]